MKSSMKKRMIAFMLCMVLIISNSVSILADTPEAETTSVEQAAETTTEKAKEATTEKKEETTTKEKKEETTEAEEKTTTEEKKEEKTEKKEEATSEEKKEETTETTEEKKDSEEETTEAKAEEATTEQAAETTTEAATEAKETVTPMELTYEDADVKVSVKATEENVIPEGTTLKVTPISDDSDQYNEIGEKIAETIIDEEEVLEGYIAYDISLVTADGEEKEPNGKVTVTMDYKKATAPDGIVENAANASEKQKVSLIHFEEKGSDVQTVDLTAKKQAEIKTTENKELQTVEFTTESFSTYSIIWSGGNNREIVFHYVNESGQDIYSDEDSNITFDKDNEGYIPLAIKHIDGYKYSSNYITVNDKKISDIAGLYYKEEGKKGNRTYNLYYLNKSLDEIKINNESSNWNSQLDVYLVYKTDSKTGDGGSSVGTLDSPEHNKYIEKNADGSYTLTLDVTGKRSESKGVDLLFVLDFSGSMNSDYVTPLKNQVEKISKKFLDGNTVNKVAAVSYSSKDYTGNGKKLDWTSESTDVINTVCGTKYRQSWNGGWSADGGTNWQNGMILADEMLSNAANDGNTKYVIFISDGEPTYRYQSYSQIANGHGSEVGAGNDDDGRNFDAAVAQFELSTYLRESTVYAIYLDDSAKGAMTKFGNAIGAVGGAQDASGTAFDTTIENIANQIMYASYKDVTISDTLSPYVDFATNSSRTVLKNGEPLEAAKYQLTEPTPANPKSFGLKILGELEKDAVYSISCKIKPNQEAEYEYSVNGYNATGDAKTDLESISYDNWTPKSNDGITSEDKAGFHANATSREDGKATLTYTQKYGTSFGNPETETYAHPVVQVKTETVSHIVNKIWSDPFGALAEVNVVLVPQITEDSSDRALTDAEINNYAAFAGKLTATLTANGNWTHTWTDLPKYYYTKDTNDTIIKYELKYTAKEILSEEDAAKYEVTVSDNGNTTTITNTELPDLIVSKIWSDYGNKYNTRPQSVTLQLQQKVNGTTEWSDYGDPITLDANNHNQTEENVWSYTFENVPKKGYEYRLVETNVPTGYKPSEYRTDNDGNLSIVNYLDWKLVKISSSTDDPTIKLQGAEFELANDKSKYTGTSNENGIVIWNNIATIPDGTYTLKETKAPAGYQLGADVTITIQNGLPVANESGTVDGLNVQWDKNSKTINVYYADDVLYELPSAGGPGIYWYLIGGMLLMMAASLILYRNKNLRRC